MAYTPVQPGQLITAAFFNQVLGGFDTRISALESSVGSTSGAMVITGLSPSGPLHMGDQVTVLGQNFGMPSQVIVTINGATVSGSNFLPGSGNNALIFQIPPVQGITSAQGQLVTMSVSNPTTSATYQFTLLPYVLTIPTGQLFVSMTGAPSVGSITAGNDYTFVFTITATTSLPDVYSLAASLDSTSSGAGWTVTTVSPTSGSSLNQIPIPAGTNTSITVGVKVAIPASTSVMSGQITLTVTSTTNPTGLFQTGSTTVKVGATPPPANTIAMLIAAVTPFPSAVPLQPPNLTQSSVTLPYGTTSAVVAVQAPCPNADSYAFTGPTFGAGWVGSVVGITGANTPPNGLSPFTTTQAGDVVTLKIQITTVPAGPANTTLTFQVQSTTPANANIIGQISPSIAVASS